MYIKLHNFVFLKFQLHFIFLQNPAKTLSQIIRARFNVLHDLSASRFVGFRKFRLIVIVARNCAQTLRPSQYKLHERLGRATSGETFEKNNCGKNRKLSIGSKKYWAQYSPGLASKSLKPFIGLPLFDKSTFLIGLT